MRVGYIADVQQHKTGIPIGQVGAGAALAELGEVQASIASLKKSVAVNPANPQAYANLGIAYRMAGKLELSKQALKEALSRFEDLNDLGECADTLDALGVVEQIQGHAGKLHTGRTVKE